MIHLETFLKRLDIVVRATNQVFSSHLKSSEEEAQESEYIILAFDLWWIEKCVVSAPGRLVDHTRIVNTLQTPDHPTGPQYVGRGAGHQS